MPDGSHNLPGSELPPAATQDSPVRSSKRRRWVRLLRFAAAAALLLIALVYFVYVLPFWGIPFNQSRHGPAPLTPPWALECWLWEDDHNTEAYLRELVEGYAKHDLPVGAVMIDSPWSERYNDFKFDEKRYPHPREFIKELHDQGCHVVLWMTCMVNSHSKDTSVRDSREFFAEARSKGYLAGGGAELKWWKGSGGFLDYSNPNAMKWWHDLQQQVLSLGVDGWKLDGCDTLFSSKIGRLPVPFKRTAAGLMATRSYMDRYCREEYRHGLTQNSNFVILVRSVDRPWTHPEGFSPVDAAAVTWVGDNRHAWNYQDRGLEAAIRDILKSAKLGYCVIGSDVAGYHGDKNPEDIRNRSSPSPPQKETSSPSPPPEERAGERRSLTNLPTPPLDESALASATPASFHDEIPPTLYVRWAEFSAFCGLFLNGGHGERRLWQRSDSELEIIRKFSWLHSELVPYMYSHVALCHQGGQPLMRPIKDGTFQYLFGNDFLVAPIHEDKLSRTVCLPPGRWRYFFNDRELIEGPKTLTRDFPVDEFPVFVREGAVVPLKVKRSYTGLGDTNFAAFTTWLIYPQGRTGFTLYHPESHPRPETTTIKVDAEKRLSIEFTGKHEPHILLVHLDQKPARVTLDEKTLSEGSAWKFDSEKHRLIITTREYADGRYEIF